MKLSTIPVHSVAVNNYCSSNVLFERILLMNSGGIAPRISAYQLGTTDQIKTEESEKTATATDQQHPTENAAVTNIQGSVGPRRNSNDFLKLHGIEPLPPGAIAFGAPRSIGRLPPRPPGQLSPASRGQNIFDGSRLTLTEADKVVLPHVLHHMTDSSNEDAINKNGFDHSKAKEDPANRFAFDPSGATTQEELECHISRSKSAFFGLGETDRRYMQTVKHEDKELYEVDTSVCHAMFPSSFSGKLIPDENNPPERNYHRIEGDVPATCVLAEPVESRTLALEAIGEHIKNAGYTDVSQSQVKNYMRYMIEKFKDEEQFEANEA